MMKSIRFVEFEAFQEMNLARSSSIRIFPSSSQKWFLNHWIGNVSKNGVRLNGVAAEAVRAARCNLNVNKLVHNLLF